MGTTEILQAEMFAESVNRCVHGKCNCESAAQCLHKRCKNCDMPVDDKGRALFDDFYAHVTTKEGHYGGRMFEFWGDDEPVPCPFCEGPMPKA